MNVSSTRKSLGFSVGFIATSFKLIPASLLIFPPFSSSSNCIVCSAFSIQYSFPFENVNGLFSTSVISSFRLNFMFGIFNLSVSLNDVLPLYLLDFSVILLNTSPKLVSVFPLEIITSSFCFVFSFIAKSLLEL